MAVEGNEASFDLCSDVQKTNSSLRKSTSPRDNEEKAIQLKFLLSNAEAGSVIEKAGSTINEIHSQFGGHFQLSHQYEYFPGISDRIIMVSGTMNEVLKAVEHILSKLLDEFSVDEDGGQTDPQSKIRLLVSNSSCGGIIGVGGAIIRSLIEDSQASIEITSKEDGNPGLHDRLVIVSGHPAQQMRAIELILLKLVEDPYYQQSLNVPILSAAITRESRLSDVEEASALSAVTELTNSRMVDVMESSSEINQWSGKTYSSNYYQLLEKRKTLSVWQQKDQFMNLINTSRCVIVVGEPGTGKSTQIPQFLLEGIAVISPNSKRCMVGCTQPNRMAAVSISKRVAAEMDMQIGEEVGYEVPFDNCCGTSQMTCL